MWTSRVRVRHSGAVAPDAHEHFGAGYDDAGVGDEQGQQIVLLISGSPPAEVWTAFVRATWFPARSLTAAKDRTWR